MLNKRRSSRLKTVLPVKISTDAGTDFVHTVDITDTGAQLGGLRTRLEPGTVVSLRRGSHKAKFRIAWVRQLAPNELRVGVECIEPQKDFWEVTRKSETAPDADTHENAVMTLLSHCARTGW
jgi:hypothetical protein